MSYMLLICFLSETAAIIYFRFDTVQGDRQFGPNTQYPESQSMPSTLGSVIVSNGAIAVNGNIIPRGMQIWTVGTEGWYDILAVGASGSDYDYGTYKVFGGRGVAAATRYYLLAGETVIVLVGTQAAGCWYSATFCGGGGSFVSKFAASSAFSDPSQHTLLLVAGGGGGVSYPARSGGCATTSTVGERCQYFAATTTALFDCAAGLTIAFLSIASTCET